MGREKRALMGVRMSTSLLGKHREGGGGWHSSGGGNTEDLSDVYRPFYGRVFESQIQNRKL